MPKDNISRAISKSEVSGGKNYENLRYEGFGPYSTAIIIETLTDNRNRSASSLRAVLQKNGGRLGESGSTTHLFENCGVIIIDKVKISEEDIFEIATSQGAKDCLIKDDTHEIITKKEDFYRIKTTLEKRIDNLTYSAIEWRAKNYLNLNKEQSEKMIELLNSLEEIDDTQNVFINANLNK